MSQKSSLADSETSAANPCQILAHSGRRGHFFHGRSIGRGSSGLNDRHLSRPILVLGRRGRLVSGIQYDAACSLNDRHSTVGSGVVHPRRNARSRGRDGCRRRSDG